MTTERDLEFLREMNALLRAAVDTTSNAPAPKPAAPTDTKEVR